MNGYIMYSFLLQLDSIKYILIRNPHTLRTSIGFCRVVFITNKIVHTDIVGNYYDILLLKIHNIIKSDVTLPFLKST